MKNALCKWYSRFFCFMIGPIVHVSPNDNWSMFKPVSFICPEDSWIIILLQWIQTHRQCDQIGQFWKFLATNFITKVGKMFGDFFGYIEKHHFLSETSCGYFWKDWATFYSYIWSHCSQSTYLSFGDQRAF